MSSLKINFRILCNAVAASILLGACVCFSACSSHTAKTPVVQDKDLVIPDLPSAKEQFGYAVTYQRSQVLSTTPERRKSQFDKMILCFERVIRNFPQDEAHTPLAKLSVADCVANKGDWQTAIKSYQRIAQEYAGTEFVRARAEFSIAKAYDWTGKYSEAKNGYRDFISQYEKSQNASVQEMVKQAKLEYFQAREEKPKRLVKK